MNRIEKITFSIGILLWFVGDLVTTYIGLSIGLVEWNPLTKILEQLFLLKLGVIAFALITIDIIEKRNLNRFKLPVFMAFVVVGLLAVINNIIQIIMVI